MSFVPDATTSSRFVPDSAHAQEDSSYDPQLKQILNTAFKLTPIGSAAGGAEQLGHLTEAAGTKLGDITMDRYNSPVLATAARLTPDIASMFLGGMFGKLLKPAIQSEAASLMQSALKPVAGKLERGQGQAAVQTALDEGISASKGGIEKLQSKIEPIDKRIEAKLAGSTADIPESALDPAIQGAIAKARYSPPSESKAVAKAVDDFKDKFYPGGGKLPVQDIQKIKQAYYRALGPESYGVIVGGEREGMKAVARGAKEAVADAVPGIAKENDALGPLLNALEVVERRVNLAGNRDLGGLAVVAHGLKGAILALVARDPFTKSIVARGLHNVVAPSSSSIGAAAGIGTQELREPRQ